MGKVTRKGGRVSDREVGIAVKRSGTRKGQRKGGGMGATCRRCGAREAEKKEEIGFWPWRAPWTMT